MARSATVIDWKAVDRLLQAGCNGVQIAARFGIHPETLYDNCKRDHKSDFSAYAAQKREHGETLLHEQQFLLAMKGDKTMLIWLGKQRLGQREKADTDITSGGKHLTGIQLLDFDGSPIQDV